MRSDLARLSNLVAPLALYAAAVSIAHAAIPVIACVDPQATMLLTDSAELARHDDAWRLATEKRGRCYRIQPSERWQPVFNAGGLVIMRKTPPQPGIPPLYFRADGPKPELSRPAPDVQRVRPAPVGAVQTEALPPVPVPTPEPSVQVPSLQVPALKATDAAPPAPVPVPVPVPAQGAVAPPSAGLFEPVAPMPAVTPAPQPADTPAQDRGYALGFGIAIILIVLLLAAVALLLRVLLRPPPEVALPPIRSPNLGPPLIRLPLLVQPVQAAPVAADGAITQPPLDAVPRETPAFVYAETAAPVLPGLVAAYAGALAPVACEPETRPASQEESPPPIPGPQSNEQAVETLTAEAPGMSVHTACATLLSEAGWDASVVRTVGSHCADVVARRGGRILAVRCLSGMVPVDEDTVEEACMARERERADLGMIVSNGSCSKAARKLAVQTGIDLLREDELAGFVGQARPVT